MPAARQDFHAGLQQKYRAGRQGDEVIVKPLREGGPAMVASGTGNVKAPPGRGNELGSRAPRSAAEFGKVMSRFGGGSPSE
jgi:hypothetical protein